jgi:hypothetical protein
VIKICLTRIDKINGMYEVFLGTSMRYKFDNKRHAKDFLRQVSKDLTESYLFISDEYLNCEKQFRYFFTAIDDYKVKYQLNNSLEYMRNRLDAVLIMPETENKNYLTVKTLESLLLELISVYSQLEQVAISRSDSPSRQYANMRCRVVNLFTLDFKNFQEKLLIDTSSLNTYSQVRLKLA